MKSILILAMVLSPGVALAKDGCVDSYFKKAKINYPCKDVFRQLSDVDSLNPNGIKSSCYGEKLYPEPSIQLSPNEFIFKSLDSKKNVVTMKRNGDYVTFYFELSPRRAYRFKREESGKCYLDSFNFVAGKNTLVMDAQGCREILVLDQKVCKNKAKEGDLTTLAMKLVGGISRNADKTYYREHMLNLLNQCRYHGCGPDPVTKRMMPMLAASFLKPYKQIVAEQNAAKKSGSSSKAK